MQKGYDAVIVGAGVIGCSIALGLARKGYRTLNIDRQAAAGYGSTANSCAIVRTHYSTLQGTAMAWESLHHWRDWGGFLGAEASEDLARYRETGILVIKDDPDAIDTFRAHHAALSIPCEDWNAERLAERLPWLETASFAPPRRPEDEGFGAANARGLPGAFHIRVGGYVNDPALAAQNLQRAAERHGAAFRFRSSVADILRGGGRVAGVELDGGERVPAPIVINAAGPHSAQINRIAGVEDGMKIRTRALRREVAYVPAPEHPDFARTSLVLSDDDIGGYARPETGGKLLVGSLDPACDPPETVDDPDDFDREVSRPQWEAQVYRMALRIPSLPIPTHPAGVADLYDVSDDWIPVYDRSDLPGFYLAIGTSGNQFKNAPVVGSLVAGLVDACENGRDQDEDPFRFTGPYTGVVLDSGFYSRLREVNRDSSFSVLG